MRIASVGHMLVRLRDLAPAAVALLLLTACDNKAPPSAAPSTASPTTGPAATRYACPMHPEVTDTKASDCPKCGMKLVPVGPDGGPIQ